MEYWKDLHGKKVQAVSINKEKDLVRIDFKAFGKSYVYLRAYGDCCSTSWFEHIEGLQFLVGGTISDVVEREMQKEFEDSNGDSIQVYGWSIKTDKGQCEIEMRNSSNGYYGGSVEFGTEDTSESPLVKAKDF
jgi:hypothetical protein